MATSFIWALLDLDQPGSDKIINALALSVAISFVIGLIFIALGRHSPSQLLRKEAIAVVGFGWFLCGLLGALPFIFSGVLNCQYQTYPDIICSAIFESLSGFTTTGASIFISPEELPRAILFWRSFTHWLGGMGIVVLFVAVLGGTGPGAKFLFSSEVPGPLAESLRPRIRSTALLLWKIYIGISVAQTICLLAQGMNLFESLCHTFGTMATGGFSTRNASIGFYNNLGIEITIIIFMILAGVNFNLHAALLHGRWKAVFKNKELRVYLSLLVLATILLAGDLILHRPAEYPTGKALRDASFQAVSIMTTTGYSTTDSNLWPHFSRWLLIVLMFIGGSAGSTGGGIKVIRIMLFARVVLLEIERTFRPNVVRPLKIGGHAIDESLRHSVCAYVGIVLVIFMLSTGLLMVVHNDSQVSPENRLDLETAFSAVAATLNNIGPGLNMVGAAANYAFFSAPAKLLLTLLMALGRLEIMVILCLFVPAFYKRD